MLLLKEKKIQPRINFYISSGSSLALKGETVCWCRKQLLITLIAAPARSFEAQGESAHGVVGSTHTKGERLSSPPVSFILLVSRALVIRLASPEVNQSSRHEAKQGSDLGPKTDVSTGLPHHLAPVGGDLEIVFTTAGISSIHNGFITDGPLDTILQFFFETANALCSHSSSMSIRLR